LLLVAMLLKQLFTAAIAGLCQLAAAQTPGACTGSCEGVSHDPTVIRRASDGTYFRFSTGGGMDIAKASSISGSWTITGQVLSSGDHWAPDVHLVGSTYYLYYATSTFGSQVSTIGLATSTTMDVGTWTDHGTIFSSTTGSAYNAIDPNLIDVDGTFYLNFGSFWNDIYQIKLSSSLTSTTGSVNHLEFNATGSHPSEGSYMYFRSPYYYLFFSSGICCGYDTSRPAPGEEYKIMVCRSESATGGFVDKNGVSCTSSGGSLVLGSHSNVYGPGGQGVFADTSSGGTVLYYHYVDTNIGFADGDKLFGWNLLGWSDGWPSVE